MSFDPCHDCGTNYAFLALLMLLWAAPIACIVFRRRVSADSERRKRFNAAIWFLLALALLASWRYVTAWWL
jgi:hypothetical protein